MKVATITILILGLFYSCLAITITENGNPSEKVTVEAERSKTQKRESSDQTAAEDKTRLTVNDQKFTNQENVKDQQINQHQYQTSFVPSNGHHYYTSGVTQQVQYAKPEINQIEYNRLEAPTSTVQYTQHYRNVSPTYQTLSYSGYHPSHAKLAAIQYVTAPGSSPAPIHYANDYTGHASIPVQYAAVALPVGPGAGRAHHPITYASGPGTYLNYAHQPSPAQVQLAYAVHIPHQVQQYLKQAVPGVQYAAGAQQISPLHSEGGHVQAAPVQQAAPASTNQHYLVAAAPAASQGSVVYSKSQSHPQQVYYAVVPNYHQGYQQAQGGYAIALQPQHQQPTLYQLQSNKQHVLSTNSINTAGPISTPHIQISQSPAILYKQQQHYIPAVVTSPSPSPAAPHNTATSFSTFSAHLPTPTSTAAAAIAHQYKAVAPLVTLSTTAKPPTIYATTTSASPAASGVIYQHQSNNHHHHHGPHHQPLQQVQHHHSPRYIYAAAAQPAPVYAHPPNNIHYGTHLYHPLLSRSIISPTPPPSLGK